MVKDKIELEKWDTSHQYHIKRPGSYHEYLGKIYGLQKNEDYAIIYEKHTGCLRGPPMIENVLLHAGKIDEDSFVTLEFLLETTAKDEASKIAKELGLKVVNKSSKK